MMPTPRVPKTHASSFNEADAFSNGQAAKPARKVHSRASIRWSDAGTAEPSAAGTAKPSPLFCYCSVVLRRNWSLALAKSGK